MNSSRSRCASSSRGGRLHPPLQVVVKGSDGGVGLFQFFQAFTELTGEHPALDGPCHRQLQFVQIAGLGEVVVGTVPDGTHCRFQRGIASEHDRAAIRLTFLQLGEQVEAVGRVDAHIQQGGVERDARDQLLCFSGREGGHHLIALLLEDGLQGDGDTGLIVNDQDARCFSHRSLLGEGR
jgi:hypothetical protein